MYGLMSVTNSPGSHDSDGFDFDEPFGLGEGGHRHQGRGGALFAEELLAHGNQVLPVPDVRQVGVDLDYARLGAATSLHLGLYGSNDFPRLICEVSSVSWQVLAVI